MEGRRMSLDTLNPVNLDRFADGPDALPVGKPTANVRYTGTYRNIGFGFTEAQEVFRVRTQPHLYDDWHVEFVDRTRNLQAHESGLYDWDCHKCGCAVMTPELSDACPICGR